MNANVSWCEITFILQNVHHRCVIQSLQQMTNDQRCYLVSRRHFNSTTKWPRTILNAPPSLFIFDIISTVAPWTCRKLWISVWKLHHLYCSATLSKKVCLLLMPPDWGLTKNVTCLSLGGCVIIRWLQGWPFDPQLLHILKCTWARHWTPRRAPCMVASCCVCLWINAQL